MFARNRSLALTGAFFCTLLAVDATSQEGRPDSRPTWRPSAPAEPSHGAESAGARAGAEPDEARQGAGRRQRGDAEGDDKDDADQTKPPRRGIPVSDELIKERCVSCHTIDDKGHMGRLSFMRKSPEGWSTSIKRMIRLYNVSLTPDDAREMVRYLANDHGLTRGEAERALYESERRVHWSEAQHDDDLKRACAQCHTLGRVLGQQRDAEEWKLLRATHLAYFPLSSRQVGGMPESASERERRRRQEGDAATPAPEGATGGRAEGGGGRATRGDRGDRVLAKLAADQPLFSKEWDNWAITRREVPLAGRWTVTGHEVGRGDVFGMVVMQRVNRDEYETHWSLEFANGERVERTGKGLLYSGYSWRGRSKENDTSWREVLLLDEDWRRLHGRLFTGEYSEFGLDVELHRQVGSPQAFAIDDRAVMIPCVDHVVDVRGEGFHAAMQAEDFHLGAGVEVSSFEFVAADRIRLRVKVGKDVERGQRPLSFGLFRGKASVVLYDTVDYIKVGPTQGLARIGGVAQPKQFERFEAVAMNRGKDDKPYTDDDFEIMYLPNVKWSLDEFRVRDDDDDIEYVGKLDPSTGFFTPAVDGPNPKRKWHANNVGDVYVVAETELMVQKLPEKKPEPAANVSESDDEEPAGERSGGPRPDGEARSRAADDVVMEKKVFRARAHLVVTVPKYSRFEVLDWKDE